MLSEVTLHLFMVSRGIGINLNLLETNLVNTIILDVGLFYILGDVLEDLLNNRLRTILSELFQRKERHLTSYYKLVRAGKVVSFSCVESWRVVYSKSTERMAIKAKVLATSQLLKEFHPHIKAASPRLKKLVEGCPVWAITSYTESSLPHIPSVGMVEPPYGASYLGISRGYRKRVVSGTDRNAILRHLTKLACRQVKGMPSYKIRALSPDSKKWLLEEYCDYVSKRYGANFYYKRGALLKTKAAAWRRFVQPEWALSVKSNTWGSTCGFLDSQSPLPWRPENPPRESIIWRNIPGWHGANPVVSVSRVRVPYPSGNIFTEETFLGFFLGDGRVDKYFSGRMLSLVVSSLSQV